MQVQRIHSAKVAAGEEVVVRHSAPQLCGMLPRATGLL